MHSQMNARKRFNGRQSRRDFEHTIQSRKADPSSLTRRAADSGSPPKCPAGQPDGSRGRKPPVSATKCHAPEGRQESPGGLAPLITSSISTNRPASASAMPCLNSSGIQESSFSTTILVTTARSSGGRALNCSITSAALIAEVKPEMAAPASAERRRPPTASIPCETPPPCPPARTYARRRNRVAPAADSTRAGPTGNYRNTQATR
jgi:hypothetical protein